MINATITGQLKELGLSKKQISNLDPFIQVFRNRSTNGCFDTYFHFTIISVQYFPIGTTLIVKTETNDTWKKGVSYEDRVYVVLNGKLYASKTYRHRLGEVKKLEVDAEKVFFLVISKENKRFEESIPLNEVGSCRGCPNKKKR